ncbi:2-dehydropantoate 2-reductase [Burkholderia sp. Ac-20365]|uniref:ketopantoate reductase family protein n=1 Tax=Burkholderia sp. Ac-20365 TaxID=2703897 RepID=UPI00197B5B97|nr:2-dehydropantoate 2-reductase [Burkholderia sp. Ac-20365]MBN3761738.1 2-dehydropantoate 2-reductase [Burkholderia sp. Ac-20365]
MKFAVMGAGAVGCFYGGMLARAGHDVTLIGRPNHVSAISRDGLRFEAASFDEFIEVTACTDASGVAGADVVLLCVKSPDTEAAVAAMRPYLPESAVIVTLQNGVDNAERVRAKIGCEVLAAVVYVGCEMYATGHVRHHGRGELIIEPGQSSDRLAHVLNEAGISTAISANVRGALWEKLVLNCAYNAISALVQLPFGELCQRGGTAVAPAMRDIVAECLAVASADGVDISGDVDSTVAKIMATIPAGQYSSTAHDIATRRPTEIDHLNGYIVRRGLALGVAAPVNHLLVMLVTVIDSQRTDDRSLKGRATDRVPA